MAIFERKKSSKAKPAISRERVSTKDYKKSSGHDDILNAVREQQPFQASADHSSVNQNLSPEQRYRDVFGAVIDTPDRSNPTRSRDERPLDTIRAFQYAATGDERIKMEMESPRLGWTTRRPMSTMPSFASNPYGAAPSGSTPTYNPSGSGFAQPSMPNLSASKTKKRGFFRRKAQAA